MSDGKICRTCYKEAIDDDDPLKPTDRDLCDIAYMLNNNAGNKYLHDRHKLTIQDEVDGKIEYLTPEEEAEKKRQDHETYKKTLELSKKAGLPDAVNNATYKIGQGIASDQTWFLIMAGQNDNPFYMSHILISSGVYELNGISTNDPSINWNQVYNAIHANDTPDKWIVD